MQQSHQSINSLEFSSNMHSTDSDSDKSDFAHELEHELELEEEINDKPQLFIHEWLAIAVILGFLLLLTLIAAIGQSQELHVPKTGQGSYLKPQEVEFHIEGAVAKPGIYRVKAGTKLKEAIIQAEPLLEADLRKIKPASRVRNGQKIVLEKREMMSITISGAVLEEIVVSVPKGLRLNELGKYVSFTEDADLEKVNSKRYIKNQEKIIIPKKAVGNGSRKGIRKKKVK